MQFIKPIWPAPQHVYAYTTTRQQGVSSHPYASFNLAQHVGDDEGNVTRNRLLLHETLTLPSNPIWLEQVHSNKVITIHQNSTTKNPIADAAITNNPETVCVVMTADCLPILICDVGGKQVGAIHAGWRGLANGVIENTIQAMDEPPSQLLAWLGPAIGPEVFEVSEDVLQRFVAQDPQAITAFEIRSGVKNKWLANIYLLATRRLNALGLTAVFGGEYCTYSDQKNFYSYRRDHGITGRMATLIWFSA